MGVIRAGGDCQLGFVAVVFFGFGDGIACHLSYAAADGRARRRIGNDLDDSVHDLRHEVFDVFQPHGERAAGVAVGVHVLQGPTGGAPIPGFRGSAGDGFEEGFFGLGLGAIPATLPGNVKGRLGGPGAGCCGGERIQRRGGMELPKLMRIVVLAAATSTLLATSGAGQQGSAPQSPDALNAALTLPNPPRISDAELSRLRDGLAAADNEDWVGLAQLRDSASDPLVKKLLEWRWASDQHAPLYFGDIRTALQDLQGWPGRTTMRQRAEQSIFDSRLSASERIASSNAATLGPRIKHWLASTSSSSARIGSASTRYCSPKSNRGTRMAGKRWQLRPGVQSEVWRPFCPSLTFASE
jgi:hypothetical protein